MLQSTNKDTEEEDSIQTGRSVRALKVTESLSEAFLTGGVTSVERHKQQENKEKLTEDQ